MNIFDAWPERLSPSHEADICFLLFDGRASEAAKDATRENLVLCSMREAFAYAKYFGRKQFDDWQIISLAYEALRRAARNFKPGGGCRFFAYAKPYVRGEVCRAYRHGDVVPRLIRVPMVIPERENPETGESYNDENPVGGSESMDFDAMHWAELWVKLEPHLLSLTKKEQSVISDFRAGLNFREMGGKRGVSRAAMQSTFVRALGKLRKAMGVSVE